MTRWTRILASCALALMLTAPAAVAQEPPPEGGEKSEGRPLDGYFATAALMGLTLFIICKSARRS